MSKALESPIKSEASHSKLSQTSEALTKLALELGPGGQLPVVNTLRRELGVSLTTLSAAMQELESRHVIERRHGVGIFVSRHLHQTTIGVVCSPLFFRPGTSPFWQRLISGLRERSDNRNMMFRFYLGLGSRNGRTVNDDLLQDVNGKRLDGIITIGNDPDAVQWLEARGLPVVSFAGRGTYHVGNDMEAFAQQAASIAARRGCKRVAIAIPCETLSEDEKLRSASWDWPQQVLTEAAQNQGLTVATSDLWDGNERQARGEHLPDSRQEQGYEAARQLFGENVHPDAVILSDDLMSRGFLIGLRSLEIAPGKDVQIITHANTGSDTLQEWQNDIVPIEFDPEQLVRMLFDVLESVMKNGSAAKFNWVAPSCREYDETEKRI